MRSLRSSREENTIFGTPNLMRIPMKMTKARATQNSGSSSIVVPSAFDGVFDRARDRVRRRSYADQAGDDGGGGLVGDASYIGHGGGLGRRDALLGLGELAVQLAFEILAVRLGRGVELVAGFGRDRLGPGAGIGQRPFVCRDGGVRLGLHAGGLGGVTGDAAA